MQAPHGALVRARELERDAARVDVVGDDGPVQEPDDGDAVGDGEAADGAPALGDDAVPAVGDVPQEQPPVEARAQDRVVAEGLDARHARAVALEHDVGLAVGLVAGEELVL